MWLDYTIYNLSHQLKFTGVNKGYKGLLWLQSHFRGYCVIHFIKKLTIHHNFHNLASFFQPRLIWNTCLYITAKLKKRTYMYDSLQFPVEMNTRGSKTLTTFIPFHTKYDLQEQFWLFSHSYLQNGMLWLLNNFNILHDLKTDTFWTLSSHIQLHMYEFTNSVSLLGSSRDTALHLGEEKLQYESRETTL